MSGLSLNIDFRGEQGFAMKLACELPGRGITAIYGPSGSGKTTLLDCIAGLRRPEPGSAVCCRGETWQQGTTFTPPWQRDIGYVFQDARLFPHLSVRGNLDYAIQRCRGRKSPDLEQVVRLLKLDKLLQRNAQALSAGQKQRLVLAVAWPRSPAFFFATNPRPCRMSSSPGGS